MSYQPNLNHPTANVILKIIASGYESIGFAEETFDIECPFNNSQVNPSQFTDSDLDIFKEKIVNIYNSYCVGKVTGKYNIEK